MTGVGIAFGIGLAITGALAFASPRRRLSILAWSALAVGWGVTVIVAPYGDKYVWVFPGMDLVVGVWAMIMASRLKCYWAAILGLLFLGQCLLHIAYNLFNVAGPTDPLRVYRYYRSINLLLIAQMVCVSWPGLWNGCVVLFNRLRGFSRHSRRKEMAP